VGKEGADSPSATLPTQRIETRMVLTKEEIIRLEREDKEMIKKFRRIWLQEFEAQYDPFTAWKWWSSPEQKTRRKEVYDQYELGNKNG
jgi:hypothetical protein